MFLRILVLEYNPANKESFDFVLDKMAYTKNKNYIFFTNLKKFNKACKNGDLDKSINSVIDVRTKHEAAAIAGIVRCAADFYRSPAAAGVFPAANRLPRHAADTAGHRRGGVGG